VLRRAPTLALLGGVALGAAWRLSYLSLLGAGPLPPLPATLAVLGMAWADVTIVALCLAALANRRLALSAAGVLFFVWVVAARLADRVYFYYSGSHVDPMVLQHAQGDALGMRLDTSALVYLGTGTAIALAALVAAFLVGRRITPRALVLPAVLLALFSGGCRVAFAVAADPATTRRLGELFDLPEVSIPRTAWRASRAPAAEGGLVLHPVVKKKLRKFGIAVDDWEPYPLVKPHVFERPLPYERTARWTAKPNVIVLFFESFSAELTSVHGKRWPGLTPNLEDFARHACVLDAFYNSSTPTVMALLCVYCSYLPTSNTTTWFLPSHGGGRTRLRGLPAILGERGYRTAHVHTLQNEFVKTGEALLAMGFQEAIDGSAIGKALGEERAHWGFSDGQLFRYLVRRLESGEQAAPFLLSAATIDSHAPFLPTRDWVRYPGADQPLLDAIHTADRGFGVFWRWFQTSPRFHDTIVVVLADHAMFPGKEHQDARPGDDVGGRWYDRTLCAIYAPTHALPARLDTVCCQLDLTPSLLHLLDVDVPNPFEGLSLFEGRRDHPELLMMHEFLFGTLQLVSGRPVLDCFRREDVEAACAGLVFDPSDPVLSRCEYWDYRRWKQSLHVADRVWKQ
jgi:hypothetical protein